MKKTCEYCFNEAEKEENTRPILVFPFVLGKRSGLVSTLCLEGSKLQLYVGGCDDPYSEMLKEKNVNYCPMCGRKLK